MKINKISITNYRSIKETQIIENIGNNLVLTGINNSWKSTVLNAVAVFLWEKNIAENDFHSWTSEINISLDFIWIEDEFFEWFCNVKKQSLSVLNSKKMNLYLLHILKILLIIRKIMQS